jgi:hypothetical protein
VPGRSPVFQVIVNLTPPVVALTILSASASPELIVTASDNVRIPTTTSVTLDIDLNKDGNFTDPRDER